MSIPQATGETPTIHSTRIVVIQCYIIT